jgi:hypothetical protein
MTVCSKHWPFHNCQKEEKKTLNTRQGRVVKGQVILKEVKQYRQLGGDISLVFEGWLRKH